MRILIPETIVDANQISAIGRTGRLVQVTTRLQPRVGDVGEQRAGRRLRQALELMARVQSCRQPARHQGTPDPGLAHSIKGAGVLHPVAAAAPPVPDVMASFPGREGAGTDMDTRHREAPVKHGEPEAHNLPACGHYLANAPRTRQDKQARGTAGSRHAAPAHAAPAGHQCAAAVIHRPGETALIVVVSVAANSLRNVVDWDAE